MKTKQKLFCEFCEKSEFLQCQINVSFVFLFNECNKQKQFKIFYSNSPIKDGSFWPATDWSQEINKWATNYEDGDGAQERRIVHESEGCLIVDARVDNELESFGLSKFLFLVPIQLDQEFPSIE